MLDVALAFLAGLLIGSFLNVCIYRLPRDLSVSRPARSFCPACRRTLPWYENVPLFSYLALGGRCRGCQARISWRYPLVEFLTAIAFAAATVPHGLSLAAGKTMLLCAILIGLIFTDLEQRILPDEFTLGGAFAGIALAALVPPPAGWVDLFAGPSLPLRLLPVLDAAGSALFIAAVLWGIGALYRLIRKRDGLGLGDVKMMGMVAAYLGLSGALLTLILGSLAGSVIGVVYIRLHRKDAATYELPFGSFLGAAALVVAVAGEPLVRLLNGQ